MNIDIPSIVNPRAHDLPEYDQRHVTDCWFNDRALRLMSNESSYRPLKSVENAIIKFVSKANWYPEDANYALGLREKLSEYTGTQPDSITLGNGSMELLDLIFHTFIGHPDVDEVILPAPDYSAYVNRMKLFGGVGELIVSGENVDCIRGDILKRISPKTKMILFSRPNNPVGKLMPVEDVVEILDQGVLTVVDEAYIEFAGSGMSTAPLLSSWKNLVVLRSFSKGFGLAGLRLGYVLADPQIIKYLNVVRHIFNVNLLAMVAGVALLDDVQNARRVIYEICSTREWLFGSLGNIPGLRPVPSWANFILVDVAESGRKAGEYVEYLHERNMIVRDFSYKQGLAPERYFRITVGLQPDMECLVDALKFF